MCNDPASIVHRFYGRDNARKRRLLLEKPCQCVQLVVNNRMAYNLELHETGMVGLAKAVKAVPIADLVGY